MPTPTQVAHKQLANEAIDKLWDTRLDAIRGVNGGSIEWTLAAISAVTNLSRRIDELEQKLEEMNATIMWHMQQGRH